MRSRGLSPRPSSNNLLGLYFESHRKNHRLLRMAHSHRLLLSSWHAVSRISAPLRLGWHQLLANEHEHFYCRQSMSPLFSVVQPCLAYHASAQGFVGLTPFLANEHKHLFCQRRTNALFLTCQIGTLYHASVHRES